MQWAQKPAQLKRRDSQAQWHPPGRGASPAACGEGVVKAALAALLIAGCAATDAMAGMQLLVGGEVESAAVEP